MQMTQDLPLFLETETIGEILGVKRTALYKLLNTADFPKVKLCGKYLIPRDRFFEWIEKQLS